MNPILINIQLVSLILCLILALHFVMAKAKRKLPSSLLGINYFLYAFEGALLIMQLQGFSGTKALLFLRPTIAMLLGPMFYLYYQSLRSDYGNSLRKRDALHAIPALLVAIVILSESRLRALIDIAILSSYLAYFCVIVIALTKFKQHLDYLGSYAAIVRQWLALLAALMGINIVLEIAVYWEISTGAALAELKSLLIGKSVFMIVNALTVSAALGRSALMEWMYEFGERTIEKYSEKHADDKTLRELFTRWQNLVEAEALYKREFGITLTEAAKKLQVPARQLSNAINHCYGKSFSQYLNDRRVQEAQRVMREQPDLNIVDVSYESGFSSKSNFNKEFSRVVGMTPTQYREKLEFPYYGKLKEGK